MRGECASRNLPVFSPGGNFFVVPAVKIFEALAEFFFSPGGKDAKEFESGYNKLQKENLCHPRAFTFATMLLTMKYQLKSFS